MAILTELNLNDAKALGALYGLSVCAVEGILAGSVNSNYALTLSDGGRVFCRVYEEQSEETAQREAKMLEHLEAHGVQTPRPLSQLSDASTFIACHRNHPVALFPWRPGGMVCQKMVTPDRARAIGAALARVHLAGETFEPLGGRWTSRFGARDLEQRIQRLSQPGALGSANSRSDIEETIASLSTWLQSHRSNVDTKATSGPGLGLIHGDLFRDNVLWRGDEISALLDFESASFGSLAFDLMVLVHSWCFGEGLEVALCEALFAGYRKVRQLSSVELNALFLQGCFAAVRFTITRITDFELRPKGSGVYKDFRRFQQRLYALEQLGPKALKSIASGS